MATITKRGGTYRIKVSCRYSADGRQITRSMTWQPAPGTTKRQEEKELNRQATLFEERVKTGQFIGSNIKFADFVETWFKDYAEKQLKPNTRAGYKALKARTNTAIGHIRLDRLQPQHILEFYNQLAETGIRADMTYKCKVDFRAKLKERKLTYSAVANAAGLNAQTLTQVSKGKSVSRKTASALCAALNEKFSEWFEPAKEAGELSGNTIKHYHGYISSVLNTAIQWQVIASNPCDRIKPPRAEKKETAFLDDEQAVQLLEALQKEPLKYQALYTLILYTGMRREEACGLEWTDIDFENNLIDINKASIYIAGKGVFDDDTKNKSSKRIIKVPASAMELLRAYKAAQAEERLKLGDRWENSGKVFTSWNGKPIHPSTVTNHFRTIIQKNNLPPVTVHGLRHTNATLMIYNGTNIKTVSARLGHSDVSTTSDIYAHAIKTADEMAAEALEDIFNRKKKTAGAG